MKGRNATDQWMRFDFLLQGDATIVASFCYFSFMFLLQRHKVFATAANGDVSGEVVLFATLALFLATTVLQFCYNSVKFLLHGLR